MNIRYEIRYYVFDNDFLCVLIIQFVCVLLSMCVIFSLVGHNVEQFVVA